MPGAYPLGSSWIYPVGSLAPGGGGWPPGRGGVREAGRNRLQILLSMLPDLQVPPDMPPSDGDAIPPAPPPGETPRGPGDFESGGATLLQHIRPIGGEGTIPGATRYAQLARLLKRFAPGLLTQEAGAVGKPPPAVP